MKRGMDSTTAFAQTEAHRSGPVSLASQKAVSSLEDRGMYAVQQPSPASFVPSSALPRPQDSRAGDLRSLSIAGEAGQLEAILNQGTHGARFAALICHPHPLGGGNLHNKVVYHAMKVSTIPRGAWACLCCASTFAARA